MQHIFLAHQVSQASPGANLHGLRTRSLDVYYMA